MQVRQGELLTLLGPSGSGKTTLLKVIAGFEAPTAGTVLLRGRDISRLSPARRGVGMVFQHYALFPHMTVAQNIGYGLKLRRVGRSVRDRRVGEMLEPCAWTAWMPAIRASSLAASNSVWRWAGHSHMTLR